MGTKLLAFLCTVDNQGTYTSALCLYPKSKEPVCFRLVSLSRACTQGRALGVLLYQGLPLKLDLDWKPAFPSDPLVSNLHSTGVTGL